MKILNFDEKLEQAIDNDPRENLFFITLLKGAKTKHLPKKSVRFNKNKHNKPKWMTNWILKSIREKHKLDKKIVKANIDDEIAYADLKAEFTSYKKIHRCSRNKAKHLYYRILFTGLLLYVCAGFACVLINLFHSHSHSHTLSTNHM